MDLWPTSNAAEAAKILRAKPWRGRWLHCSSVIPPCGTAMLLRRALPATRQSLAHSFPIYEMGSNATLPQMRLA